MSVNHPDLRGIHPTKLNQHLIRTGGGVFHVCPVCGDAWPLLGTSADLEERLIRHLNEHTMAEILQSLANHIGTPRELKPGA
jgi:hypothetical protein